MNIYQTVYDLFNTYIFNGEALVGTYPDLILVILSTLATISVVAIPFYIAYRVIRMLTP